MEPHGWTRQDQADAVRLYVALEARKASRTPRGPGEIFADGFNIMVRDTARLGKTRRGSDSADRPLCREDSAGTDRAGHIGSTLPAIIRVSCQPQARRAGELGFLGVLRPIQARQHMNDNGVHWNGTPISYPMNSGARLTCHGVQAE